MLRSDGLAVVAGVGMYTVGEVSGLSAAASLRTWAARPLPTTTAFTALYLGSGPDEVDRRGDVDQEVLASVPLTPTQRQVVAISRVEPVSVVSGAAGTGKSHTVTAIACDAIGRGETVLVATKTDAAVDALLVLLRQAPGLEPVVFGSSERREELAQRLASGELLPAGKDEVEDAVRALQSAVTARDELTASIVQLLDVEANLQDDGAAVEAARLLAPGCFDPACDLAEARRLVDGAGNVRGWWGRRRARSRLQRAMALVRADRGAAVDELTAAVEVARRARVAGDLVAAGGLDLSAQWSRLEALEAEVHDGVATWLAVAGRSPDRLSRASREAVAVLATALRSGRAARREQLARLDARLTRALPLWVGTLGDVEDLLRRRPACSTWSFSTRRQPSTSRWPRRRCCGPGGRWWSATPTSCATSRSWPTSSCGRRRPTTGSMGIRCSSAVSTVRRG